jgi:hypothetical protein
MIKQPIKRHEVIFNPNGHGWDPFQEEFVNADGEQEATMITKDPSKSVYYANPMIKNFGVGIAFGVAIAWGLSLIFHEDKK